MDVQAQIRIWLLKQNDWLQEAADRLLKNGELSPPDITALVAILKTPAGQKPTKHRGFTELTSNPQVGNELGGVYNPRYKNWIFDSGRHDEVLERLRSLSGR